MRAALFAASMSALAAATMTWNVSESGAQHRAHQAFGAAPGSAPDWSFWSWGSWCVRATGEPVRFGDAAPLRCLRDGGVREGVGVSGIARIRQDVAKLSNFKID